MFWRIVRHEWRSLAADSTVWVVAAVFAAAIGYGVWTGARWVTFQHAALEQAQSEEAERYGRLQRQIEELARGAHVPPFADPRNPSSAGARLAPRYATLSPSPLAATAVGQSDLLPYYYKVSTDALENIVAASEIENPHRLLVGRFDLAFVVIFLYPLLILGVTYNMLSAEQEQRTLALVLSQPVSLATLVAGKVGLRALVVVGTVLVCSIVALGAGGSDFTAHAALVRSALSVGALGAYGAFWFALAILVTSRAHGSTTNATILAGVWLALVVLLPSLLNMAATTVFPVPSRVEMVQALRVASDEANASGSTLLARYYEDHPELATGDAEQAMTDFNVIRVAVNDEVARRVRPVVERYEHQIARQQQIISMLRFLSPAVLMQDALYDIAGTGVARHRHFLDQVHAYHREWRDYFVPLIVRNVKLTSFDEVPRFHYREESIADVALRVVVSLLGLIIPAMVLGAIGLASLRRYPVTG
jgi:ABC-2 type transport system permease protein